MDTSPAFPVDRMGDIQAAPENFRLLERVPLTLPGATFPMTLAETSPQDYAFAVLDVETTGFSPTTDRIIELGIVTGRFSLETGRITSITGAYSLYEDPGMPIPPEITELTGITNEMVAGQRIDDDLLARIIHPASLIIAHNAAFDRPFFEARIKRSEHPELQRLLNCPWACTLNNIDWAGLGYRSRSLETLLLAQGFFYTAHRASVDALATAWLLECNRPALRLLLDTARRKSVIIRAIGAPFETKDALKARGYSWSDGSDGSWKCWWRSVDEALLEDELTALDSLYHNARGRAQLVEQTARTRFKAN